jgi:hypothetical protein
VTDYDEQFVAGMAHCYYLLAQELRVKREAFDTVWEFYYQNPGLAPGDNQVEKQLALASSVIDHLETNLEGTYFDAIDAKKRNAVQWPDMQHEEDSLG